MIGDFPTLQEVLSKLEKAGVINIIGKDEEINDRLYPLDVTLESKVLCNHPTRSAGEILERQDHESERQNG